MNPRDLFALAVILFMCVSHFRSWLISTQGMSDFLFVEAQSSPVCIPHRVVFSCELCAVGSTLRHCHLSRTLRSFCRELTSDLELIFL